jgi:hypothetical protein
MIDDLNYDEQIDLVTLAWLGRDGGSLNDWASLRSQAMAAHNERTADYLLGMPCCRTTSRRRSIPSAVPASISSGITSEAGAFASLLPPEVRV